MTGLPTETLDVFAAWHPKLGFNFQSFRFTARLVPIPHALDDGWRVVPVTITIAATGTGEWK